MADVSTSAAKAHVLKGSGDVSRISKEGVQLARGFAHAFLAKLGEKAAVTAQNAKRKTIMPEDIEEAGKSLGLTAAAVSEDPAAEGPAQG